MKIELLMFYFAKNDHEIIAKYRCGAGGDVLAPQQVDGGALMEIHGKAPEHFCPFKIWRTKKEVKIEES